MAMIGGGKDAFIGAVHRLAMNMDGQVELVAGALSVNAEVAIDSGKSLFLDEERIYTDYKLMLEKEAAMPADKRIDFITIVTPNFVHFEPAMMALEKGFHVVIEKPITFTLEQAKQLKAKVEETDLCLLLCHTYNGYPMVKQAKQFLKSGALGKIRKIYVEYPQGWLSTFLEATGQAQASWRTDPKKSGKAGSMGDIGTHAFNLAEYVTGLQVTHICSDINIVVEGRMLDDDGAAFLKFNNGATGVLMATQIAAGEENLQDVQMGYVCCVQQMNCYNHHLFCKSLLAYPAILQVTYYCLHVSIQCLPFHHTPEFLHCFLHLLQFE